MKALFLMSFIFLSSNILAETFRVVERSEKNKQIFRNVELEDLESNHSFEGKYFKIVLGKSDDAINFDSSEDILLKAATTYYHLSKARNYFIETIGSKYVQGLEKIVIRLELTNKFSELGHFTHDRLEPEFNNALTVPSGIGMSSRGVKPWGKEIWFRPSKKVHLSEVDVKNESADMDTLVSRFRNQIHMQSFQRFISQLVLTTMNNEYVTDKESMLRTIGASLFLELAYQFQDEANYIFTRKWYWLDSALVPEVIYHEYAHIALSDNLELTHSTPVIEGMADYFAGKIADSKELAKNIKKYNTFNGKEVDPKSTYRTQFETNEWANTDFIFGLLWEVGKVVGKSEEIFIYDLREEITTDSSIRGQLIDGILKTCRKSCEDKFNNRIQLLKLFNGKKI